MTSYAAAVWNDPADKPAKRGIFLRDYRSIPNPVVLQDMYSKWDGQQWLCGATTVGHADDMSTCSAFQHLPWRSAS